VFLARHFAFLSEHHTQGKVKEKIAFLYSQYHLEILE